MFQNDTRCLKLRYAVHLFFTDRDLDTFYGSVEADVNTAGPSIAIVGYSN